MTLTRPTWDETWLDVAYTVAKRSKCTRDKVGAVIVNDTNRIVATGYNGPPADFKAYDLDGNRIDSLPCNFWCTRSQNDGFRKPEVDYSDCPALHAEANALSVCDRSLREDGTIYVTSSICFGCAKLIGNSGLFRVVISSAESMSHRDPGKSYRFLESCGLEVIIT